MSKYEKLLIQILKGDSDSNISFDELCNLVKKLGFEERIKGSHHVFRKQGIIKKLIYSATEAMQKHIRFAR